VNLKKKQNQLHQEMSVDDFHDWATFERLPRYLQNLLRKILPSKLAQLRKTKFERRNCYH
jgi:hypothetical protein